VSAAQIINEVPKLSPAELDSRLGTLPNMKTIDLALKHTLALD